MAQNIDKTKIPCCAYLVSKKKPTENEEKA